MAKQCLPKKDWYFFKRCCKLALPSSLRRESFQLNFLKISFHCACVFFGFNPSFPRRVMISSWMRFSLSCPIWLNHHTSPQSGSIVSHRFVSVRGATGWEYVHTPLASCSWTARVRVSRASWWLVAGFLLRGHHFEVIHGYTIVKCLYVVVEIGNLYHCFPLCQGD